MTSKDPLNEELGFYVNLLSDEFGEKDADGNVRLLVPNSSMSNLVEFSGEASPV